MIKQLHTKDGIIVKELTQGEIEDLAKSSGTGNAGTVNTGGGGGGTSGSGSTGGAGGSEIVIIRYLI